jgi:DNA-binding transcriptional LysR family regulator
MEAAMELKDIDLNLLVVFNQLLLDRRVSIAAESLGLTQPAVSNALARLRKLLGDELFLRTSRGMEPTPLAAQLAQPIADALSAIHGTLNRRASFEAKTSTRAFTIAMTDIGEIYFLPALMDALAKAAPGVTISTVRNTAGNLKDEMEAGRVDLAIGFLPQLKTGFFQRRLFRNAYVCMFRKGHKLDNAKVSVKDFAAAEHLVVISAGTGHGKVDEVLERSPVRRRIRLKVPHFVAIGHILHATDMIATVPERLAQRIATPFDLGYVKHPMKLPEIPINLFWHAKYHREPGNQWLRTLVFGTFSE